METELRIENNSQLKELEQKNIESGTTTIMVWFEQLLEIRIENGEVNIELKTKNPHVEQSRIMQIGDWPRCLELKTTTAITSVKH